MESTWSDHEVSRQIATEAGHLLIELRDSVPESAGERWLRDEGDARSHRMIMDRLAELRPDDAILSEEGKDDPESPGDQATVDPSVIGTADDYQLARAVDMLRGIALFSGPRAEN